MYFQRRQSQFVGNFGIFNCQRLIDCATFDPFSYKTAGRNRTATAIGFKLGICNYLCFWINFYLEFEYVSVIRTLEHRLSRSQRARSPCQVILRFLDYCNDPKLLLNRPYHASFSILRCCPANFTISSTILSTPISLTFDSQYLNIRNPRLVAFAVSCESLTRYLSSLCQ
jgi:hypothetical protein